MKIVNKDIITKVISEVLNNLNITLGYSKNQLFIKCNENSATRRGKGAVVTLAKSKDLKNIPLRHLQDKGYDSDGNHLGYICKIDYPDGTSIDFVEGTLTIDDVVYQMGFDDNYKRNDNGDVQHILKGSANGLFKQQRKDILNQENGREKWKTVLEYGTLMKNSKSSNDLDKLLKKGVDIHNDEIRDFYKGSGVGKLIDGFDDMNNIAHNTNCDYENIVASQQVRRLPIQDRRRIIDKGSSNMTSTSVGFLNDKSLMIHNKVTGDSRSVDGKTYNWDNTYKVYTIIPKGSDVKGVYLGYAQNEKISAWDNSGNSHNELVFSSNQKFRRLLVDEKNEIIIQIPIVE